MTDIPEDIFQTACGIVMEAKSLKSVMKHKDVADAIALAIFAERQSAASNPPPQIRAEAVSWYSRRWNPMRQGSWESSPGMGEEADGRFVLFEEAASAIGSLRNEIEALKADRNLFKGKYRSIIADLNNVRQKVQEVVDHLEDEGDRAYLGSTNHADMLRDLVDDMDGWSFDAMLPKGDINKMESDPYAAIWELRVENEGLRMALGYQDRVAAAHHALFHDDPTDIAERNARGFEESIETAQAFGMTKEEAIELVEYTFSRPVGEPAKELGAKILTTFSLAVVAGINAMDAAEADLEKLQRPETIARIRAKRATRHGRGPLPGFDPAATEAGK